MGEDGHHLLTASDTFVCHALSQGLPAPAVPVFCAACLTPLQKPHPSGAPDGTQRIAAGEVLRRLAGKLLMRNVAIVRELKLLSLFNAGWECRARESSCQ